MSLSLEWRVEVMVIGTLSFEACLSIELIRFCYSKCVCENVIFTFDM